MERDELIALVRATGMAVERGGYIFLIDPAWSAARRELLEKTVFATAAENPATPGDGGWLCIPTGGTSGAIKFARHDEQTLGAAVAGFRAHFQLGNIEAIDVLPPHHVSGLMARVRCAAGGGRHLPWSWKDLASGNWPKLGGDIPAVISLVPTQLQRLLSLPGAVDWLRLLHLIYIGGGPVWPALAEEAARARLPIILSYGMTETAAMAVAGRPGDFAGGSRSSGVALPHVRISLDVDGRVRLAGASVFRGYFPDRRADEPFLTEDLGRLDAAGELYILGRRDAVIITGGEKVNPTAVEATLLATGEFADVAILGVPHPKWGQAVVACYPAGNGQPDLVRAGADLTGPERPKRYIAVADWPRNAQGKLDRSVLARSAAVDVAANPIP